MEKICAWDKYDSKAVEDKVEEFALGYREFISTCKTERECASAFVERASKLGYTELGEYIKSGAKLKAGDKIYALHMNKTVALINIGKRPIEEGLRILGAHIDSPRLDIKQDPLYEDGKLALLDTHYYGGIKKYQWVALPLAIHGIVVKLDGTVIPIVLGEKDDEPVTGVTDLLIHLASKQLDKTGKDMVEGEALNLLVGSIPKPKYTQSKDTEAKERVKANILDLLKYRYGIREEDFISAELEVVPAGRARNFGLDNSMIMGYGQDDRVCAYPSVEAMLSVDVPEYTNVCLLVDKEEIGSVGATGMHSKFFENVISVLCNIGEPHCGQIKARMALEHSKMLSSDVSAAYDPNYPDVMQKTNCANLGYGMALNKFTGSRGKVGSSDANAEYLSYLRRIFSKANVAFQFCELGKVDAGGGGTIAYIMANYGMEVVDSGVAVLNMHAPWEVTSKADIYESFKGYKVFLES